jgi:F-type H+-transporting ATPase subunit a
MAAEESAGHATEVVGHGAEQVAGIEQVAAAAEHAEEGFDVGASIIHHILDAPEIPIPFTHSAIPLPEIHLFGLDISITLHVVMMWLASLILIVMFWRATRTVGDPVPRGIRNLLESMMLYVRDEIARKAIGDGADRYVGYLMTTFFFILCVNLLGLVPGMATATGNISVTAGLAISAFIMIQWSGIRKFGVIGHYKHLAPGGLPLWLVPLMVFVEFLGMLIKPFSLCIRLFANMMAGHVVILALISLIFILGTIWVAPVAVAFALFIYLLELLVSFIQAFIFTMLTAQFIGMSVHPH